MDGELGIEDSVGIGHDDVLLEHAVAIRVVERGHEERDARHPRHGLLSRLVEGQSAALHLVGSCISGLRDVYHDPVLADGYALRPAFVHQIAFGRLDLADLVCAIGEGARCQLRRAAGIGDERADERARAVECAAHEDGGFGARPHAEARPAQCGSSLGHPVSGLGIDLADAEATADDGVGEGRCDPDDRSRRLDGDQLGLGRVEIPCAGLSLSNLVGSDGKQIGCGGSMARTVRYERGHDVARREARSAYHDIVRRSVDDLEHGAVEVGVTLVRNGGVVILVERNASALDLLFDDDRLVSGYLGSRTVRENRADVQRRVGRRVRGGVRSLEVVRCRRGQLLDRERPEWKHDRPRSVAEKIITRHKMVLVHDDLAVIVGLEEPGAQRCSRHVSVGVAVQPHEEPRTCKRGFSLGRRFVEIGVHLGEKERDGMALRLLIDAEVRGRAGGDLQPVNGLVEGEAGARSELPHPIGPRIELARPRAAGRVGRDTSYLVGAAAVGEDAVDGALEAVARIVG